MKLICFSYAGGNSLFFDNLKRELLPDVELFAIDYAGHGKRHKSPFYNDFSELANDMYDILDQELQKDEPYALMGYSMGSISAFEVLRLITERGRKLPEHIFLAAHEPKTKAELQYYNDEKMNDFVKKRTIEFGAVPEKLINNKSFWRMYLPIYQADYYLIGKYRFETVDFKSDVPVTVFYSESDTPYEDMKEWERYFPKSSDYVEYEGNHLFMNEHFCEIANDIKERLNCAD